MPRTFMLTCDRQLSDKVTPGNRVKIVGVLSIMSKTGGDFNSKKQVASSAVKVSYIRVVGI